ncbi:Ger(x)C family spore germination protein [Paenibacillus sp. GCM10027628]|uniref:Ger(x)C family spore germination protein n=1 Tax=Paenibacillus sp. GCM10027628 TaxID=3273413 RepID=UPI00362673FB
MKTWACILILAVLMSISGCGKKAYIETQRFALLIGVDLDEENNLVVYTTNPVFSKEAKVKYKITSATADSLRESRKKIDIKLNGNLAVGKIQNVIIGKKLLQQRNVFPYLDSAIRNAQIEVNAGLIMVDGSVKEMMYTNMNDKGRIGAVVKQMLDSTYNSRITVQTTLQEFHQQMMDKGTTPYISEMKAEKNDLVITGTALLHKDGTYAASLNNQESSLLLLLQQDTKNRIQLTFHLPQETFDTDNQTSYVSFDIIHAKVKPVIKFQDNRFHMDVRMNIQIDLTERLFTVDMEKNKEKMELAIQKLLKKQCETLIRMTQKKEVDPFRFGVHVRADDYKNWKKVEDNWGKAFSEATVTVSPKVTIKSIGVSE